MPIGFEETDKKQKDFHYATAKSYLVTDVCASAQSQFLTQKNDALEIWLYGLTSILSWVDFTDENFWIMLQLL